MILRATSYVTSFFLPIVPAMVLGSCLSNTLGRFQFILTQITMKESQMLKNAVQEQIEHNEKVIKRAAKIIKKDKKKGVIK